MRATNDCILLSWRAAMLARGVAPLPTEQELRQICAQGQIPDPPSPTIAPWVHVIAFLQAQSRFGVTWESLHLTPDLLTPRPVAPTPQPQTGQAALPSANAATPSPATSTPEARAMEQLRAWRSDAEASGRLKQGGVTDGQLMFLVRSLAAPEDVGRRVRALAPFDAELFALITDALGRAPRPANSAADDLGRTRPRSALGGAGIPPASQATPGARHAEPSPAPTVPLQSAAPLQLATQERPEVQAEHAAWVPGTDPVYPPADGMRRATAPAGPPNRTANPAPAPSPTSPPEVEPASRIGSPTNPGTAPVTSGSDGSIGSNGSIPPRSVITPVQPAADPEPAPTATTTSGPVDTVHGSVDSAGELLGGYAEAMSVADQPATTIVEQVVEEGQVTYRWPALPGIVTIFRVVVSDAQRPLVPEMGDILLATTTTSALDPAPVNSLFRFVQIWANSGSTVAEAKAAQPQLHAECVRVGGVTEASGTADFGQVSLVWAAPGGAQRVRVYRLPDGVNLTLGHAAFEISTDRDNLTGCLDRGGTPGASYTYRMIVEARDGTGAGHTSGPVDVRLEWPAVIREITDLAVHVVRYPTQYDPGEVDLEWTQPPVSLSHIFRIEEPVGPGILGVKVDKGALPQMGFTDVERCRNPIELPDASGKVRMLGVVWPPNWARIYFVPVTILGQQALPGTPVSSECIVPPGDPRLVDRVTEQVVTFVWPPGATYVRAHLGPLGAAPQDICAGTWHTQVSEEDYRRHGGLRLQLAPTQDMAVFLTASRGQTVSEAVTVPLTRRLRIQYAVEIRRRMRVGPVDYARVAVWAPNDAVQGPPPFVVVFRDDRLPMHARDGTILGTVPDEAADGSAPIQAFRPATLTYSPDMPKWRILVPGGVARGYLRVFVSPGVPPELARRIVVLDPPVAQLRWG
ncbi:hypothetical protein [Nostocoides vanveenii]|uniref:Fibronectin type-III domain-containing protein n=1 Tax=Nostocoides vanveenii TaxID=330835 RepID=A0ABN2KDL4_9MICO